MQKIKKRKKASVGMILIIIVVLAILGVGGYFVFSGSGGEMEDGKTEQDFSDQTNQGENIGTDSSNSDGCWIVMGGTESSGECIKCTEAPSNAIQVVNECNDGPECYEKLRNVGWPTFKTKEECQEWKENPTEAPMNPMMGNS